MIPESLLTSFKQGNVILFVGAGVSMNLGLPSWNDLISKIAVELDYDPDIYKTLGDHYALAEYYRITKGSIEPLKSWMDKEWHSNDIDVSKSKIHELIVRSGFPIIYTTNYDRWLENAFDHYKEEYIKVASVSDVTKIRDNKTQIIKFHGDFDLENSIVLDESSYFERLEFESPLDIKLRSDILGKTVLFIGYGLSDINLRFLFYKLAKLWKVNSYGVSQPNSYIFSGRPNPVQEAVLKQWKISMITSDVDDPSEALSEFLNGFLP